ncbi:hypothetical protein [Thiothrix subterranea]|uniref:Uncharacterized protein n=1 Tax=Thiothrix subterranea TaxID=2735563 RepID=A0AA51MR13_9GAMM|nr:hypothetical protein [Thiothrix subterranea]MDQ5767837.1 hypothetical protein [Thiothrix subterranea]WML86701.1 hypothetical protein RCG00_20760 [Thiothrix subterranea]
MMKKIDRLISKGFDERLHQLDRLTVEIARFFAVPTENRFWPLLKNQRITLLTDDPHFATQARFQQHLLCKYLSKCLNTNIRGIDIKVIGLHLASIEQKTSEFRVSSNTASIMKSIAQSIDDKELREAIEQLAKTASRPVQGVN